MKNHLAAAKVLDELLLELIENGAAVSAHVVEDLKAARALASMAARQPGKNEALEANGAATLENVEMNLLSQAEITGGAAYADAWQARIAEAYQEESVSPAATKMPHGVPRGEYWVRIQTSTLEETGAAPAGVTAGAAQEDGFTLVYGKKENVTAFLDEIRQKEIRQNGKVGFQRNS